MRWTWLVLGTALAGCPRTPPPACITVDTTCAPGYVPTFDNVFKNTIETGCGSTRASCHSASGHMGNLDMHDEPTAYASLLSATRPRVKPGDPGCSLMIVRTDSPGADYQMPPGDPLSEAERCALIQWVQSGAPGPGSGSAQ